MSTSTTRAHPAAPHERSQVVTALCGAFFDDPVYQWLVPDTAQRRRSAATFFPRVVDACWSHGGVYAAAQGSGAALWLPPGKEMAAGEDAEAFVTELLDSAGDDAGAQRMAQLFELLDAHHPAEPSWYLAFMAVEPAAQGRGIGTDLLAAVLAHADRDETPAYLEASCPGNRRLYERHGFRTVRELTVADSPTIYAMWRSPQTN